MYSWVSNYAITRMDASLDSLPYGSDSTSYCIYCTYDTSVNNYCPQYSSDSLSFAAKMIGTARPSFGATGLVMLRLFLCGCSGITIIALCSASTIRGRRS